MAPFSRSKLVQIPIIGGKRKDGTLKTAANVYFCVRFESDRSSHPIYWVGLYKHITMRLLSILFCSLFFISTSTAQYSAKATVDSTHMMIGDQMKLYLEVAHPPGVEKLPLIFKKEQEDAIEFLAQSHWDTLAEGDKVRIRKDLLFTAWDSGYQIVPPIPLVFLQNGKRDTIYTRDISIEVLVPPADSILSDIKPIIEERVVWKDYIPHIGTVALLLLIVLVWYFFKNKKGKEEYIPPPLPPLPAHEIALGKLSQLKNEKLWQQGKVKEYHSQLTYIVREYLENRYNIQALEQITNEILGQMKKMNLNGELTAQMTQLLQTADLVKFAKAEPPAEYHESAWKLGEEFVRATKKTILPSENTATEDVKLTSLSYILGFSFCCCFCQWWPIITTSRKRSVTPVLNCRPLRLCGTSARGKQFCKNGCRSYGHWLLWHWSLHWRGRNLP